MVKKLLNKLKKQRILVIVGGNKIKIEPFIEAAHELQLDVTTASFQDLSYTSDTSKNFALYVGGVDVRQYTKIYIRVVGKRLEDATLLANYAHKHGIALFDRLYGQSLLMPSSLGKSIETMKLIEKKVAMPKTYFGSLQQIKEEGISFVGFPCVIKSTTGKKAREVWSPETKKDFESLIKTLSEKEADGMRFFAQEFVPASERVRVFVLGGKALAAIVRPTKWRKRFGGEGRKESLNPVPSVDAKLAVEGARALGLDIAGVDIVHDDKTGEAYILEVNAAPAWKALAKSTGIFIEKEILKFISKA